MDREAAFRALERIYSDLRAELDVLRPICRVTGRCCRFREYGHQLWATPLEIEYLLVGAGLPAEREEGVCPYLVAGRAECGARPWRVLGCRTFYCDPAYRYHMEPLHERYHGRVRELHGAAGIPYRYEEFLGKVAAPFGPYSPERGREEGWGGWLPGLKRPSGVL